MAVMARMRQSSLQTAFLYGAHGRSWLQSASAPVCKLASCSRLATYVSNLPLEGWNGTSLEASLDTQCIAHGFAKALPPDLLLDLIGAARVKKGRDYQADKRFPIKQNDPGERWCSRCMIAKSPHDFYRRLPGNALRSYCKTCAQEMRSNHYQTLRGTIQSMVAGARARSQSRSQTCTLTFDDVIHMVLTQHGRCHYSGVPMELQLAHSHWRMSLERLDNNEGYTTNNCVLVAAEFNTSDYSRNKSVQQVFGTAQWSRPKVRQVRRLRSGSSQPDELFKLIGTARESCRGRAVQPKEPRESNKDGWWPCGSCGLHKPAELFYANARTRTGQSDYCKECARSRTKEYQRTLRGNAVTLVAHARNSAKARGHACDLTFADVLDMLASQKARCYYSRVPMEFL